MCSYRHTNVRFVPELGSKATQVEKELEVANQKAHAARWSHAKRKLGKEHKNAFKANSNRKSSLIECYSCRLVTQFFFHRFFRQLEISNIIE